MKEMIVSRWKQFQKVTVLGIVFIFTISVGGCTDVEELQYDTNCNQQKLVELKGKTLVIISNEYNDKLIQYGDTLEPSIAQIIADNHKYKLMDEFNSLFHMRDVSSNFSMLKGRGLSTYNPKFIIEFLQDVNADGAILITNSYGYKLSSSLIQGILEAVLPKDWVRTMFGSSNVEMYLFASNMYIVNKEGSIIWNFYGKAYALPEASELLNLEEFGRSFAGLDPSTQRLVKAFIPLTNHFTEYIRWLVEADINESQNKNYYTDFPEEKKEKRINVYPASDKSHLPFLSDIP